MKSVKDTFKELSKNPEFVKAYKELEPQHEIAREVIKKRIALKMSQQKLADLSGLKQANIARLESGHSNATINTLERIAEAMGYHFVIKLKKNKATA